MINEMNFQVGDLVSKFAPCRYGESTYPEVPITVTRVTKTLVITKNDNGYERKWKKKEGALFLYTEQRKNEREQGLIRKKARFNCAGLLREIQEISLGHYPEKVEELEAILKQAKELMKGGE